VLGSHQHLRVFALVGLVICCFSAGMFLGRVTAPEVLVTNDSPPSPAEEARDTQWPNAAPVAGAEPHRRAADGESEQSETAAPHSEPSRLAENPRTPGPPSEMTSGPSLTPEKEIRGAENKRGARAAREAGQAAKPSSPRNYRALRDYMLGQ
jgi:hypothetical protein